MGKKVDRQKQRNSYNPKAVFMSDGTGDGTLTEEEKLALATSKKERDLKSLELKARASLDEREYNKSLFQISEDLKQIVLPNNNIIVRLFLKPPTGAGLYLAKGGSILNAQDPDHTKFEIDRSHAASALHRGVVVAIGETCSEVIKRTVEIGDIVDLHMNVNPNNFMLIIDKESIEFENYYSIPETYIHYKWKTDPKGYRLGSTPSHQEDKMESPTTIIELD